MSGILLRLYGDSLALPRFSDGVRSGDTYFERLSAALRARVPGRSVHAYNRSMGGARVEELAAVCATDSTYFGEPDHTIIVIQCGVVDCAPRVVPRSVRAAVSILPAAIRSRIIGFLHTNRARILTLGPAWRKTTPAEFSSALRKWLLQAMSESAAIVVINVAPTTPVMDDHSPGFSDGIEMYNKLIAEAVRSVNDKRVLLVDIHSRIRGEERGIDQYINATDGHHITIAGHELYSRMVLDALEPMVTKLND